MLSRLWLSLLGIVLGLALVLCAWQLTAHFDFEPAGFLPHAALSFALALGGVFYLFIRKDDDVSGLLFGISFLISLSTLLTLLNHFALSIAGPRIDDKLAAIDRSMGFNWPDLMRWIADHPPANDTLWWAYWISGAQIVLVMIFLATRKSPELIGRLCLTLAICGPLTIAIWTAFPSFGAITVYFLPADIAGRMPLVVDLGYAHYLVDILKHGPGKITSISTKGLVGFPSFHAAEAVIATWFVRRWNYALAGLGSFNIVVLISTPFQGGHHLVDLFGGIALAFFAIFAARRIADVFVQAESGTPA